MRYILVVLVLPVLHYIVMELAFALIPTLQQQQEKYLFKDLLTLLSCSEISQIITHWQKLFL